MRRPKRWCEAPDLPVRCGVFLSRRCGAASKPGGDGTGTPSRGFALVTGCRSRRVYGKYGRDVEAEGEKAGPGGGGYRAGRKWRWGWTWLNEIGGSLISLIDCGARKGSPKAATLSIGWRPSDWSTSKGARPARDPSPQAAAMAAATATSAEASSSLFAAIPAHGILCASRHAQLRWLSAPRGYPSRPDEAAVALAMIG
jgi:hypothetical protein